MVGTSKLPLNVPEQVAVGQDRAVGGAVEHREAAFLEPRPSGSGSNIAVRNRQSAAKTVPAQAFDEEMLKRVLAKCCSDAAHFHNSLRPIAAATIKPTVSNITRPLSLISHIPGSRP